MFALLALLVATLLSAPTVTLTVTQQAGPRNIHLHYVVTGPYDGRACLDIDDAEEHHVAAFCSDDTISVKAGATASLDEDVHGPVGKWIVMPVLPDTPGDDEPVTGLSQLLTIAETRAARR